MAALIDPAPPARTTPIIIAEIKNIQNMRLRIGTFLKNLKQEFKNFMID